MIDVRFTDEMNPARAARVADVLRGERLFIETAQDYGMDEHDRWVEKSEAELCKGTRFALLGTNGLRSTGVIVWRPSEDEPPNVASAEIRNISISPDDRRAYYGSFMLRALEIELAAIGFERASVDTKLSNHKMLDFLFKHGYSVDEVVDLYASGVPDVVLHKRLVPTP